MTNARVVITTEAAHCKMFRCMADAAGYKYILLREGEHVLITSSDPATGEYDLTALVHTDHRDEIWGGPWDSLAMAELGRWVKVVIESEYSDGTPLYYCDFSKPLTRDTREQAAAGRSTSGSCTASWFDPVPMNMTPQ